MTLAPPNQETLARLDEILKSPSGRRVGVLGLGIAGKAMALYLARRGARVLGADRNPTLEAPELTKAGVEIALGGIDDKTFAECEALALAPGADPRQAAVQGALRRRLPVFGELELCGNLPAKVAAITGTNGKSTTTALLGELVRSSGKRAFVGGNLGDPIAAWLDRDEQVDVAVIELSSFQLETAYRFAPDVAIVLNVTPDHADRYVNIDAYAAAKQRLVENLRESSVAVLSQDDARVARMSRATKGKIWWFSTQEGELVGSGARLRGHELVASGELEQALGTIELEHPRLFGRHNRENALAAFLAGHALALPKEGMERGYRAFPGLEHRLEWVCEAGGVRFINDSKATNDDAAAVALRAVGGPIVLLLGGRDKGAGYAAVREEAMQKARVVIAFGEARHVIAGELMGHEKLVLRDTLADAVRAAQLEARSGETVLLAPACSSFDEFENYAQRGRVFKETVRKLTGGGTR